MPRVTATFVVFVAMLCSAVASADPRRVAVLQPDPALLRAISLALDPWGLETVAIDTPPPSASQPEAVRAASKLARQLGVEAVVWLTTLQQGSLLWVFDVRTGDVVTRLLSEQPPFDGASAASVALTVKTVLRASVVAPPQERFGAPPRSPTEGRTAALEVGPGLQWFGADLQAYRVEVRGVLWLVAARRLGLSFELSSGPALRIAATDYSGRYRERALGAKARLRLVEVSSFSTMLALGGAARWTNLEGAVADTSQPSEVQRLNGSIDLEVLLNFKVANWVYLGASVGAAYLPMSRRYSVRGDPVFSPWPLTPSVTGYCGVELF